MNVVNIIGCGPTGMTIAWELSKHSKVHVYDRKPGPGGSWWEPDERRDLHSYRAVFDRCFINTRDLLREMGLRWSDYFGSIDNQSPYPTMFKMLGLKDYWELTKLSTMVLLHPGVYKTKTLKESIGNLSPDGEKFISSLPYVMDGVSWDTMTAFEFVKSFDWVALSNHQTQIVSGAKMFKDMEQALRRRGVTFHYNTEILGVRYGRVDHEAFLVDTDETITGDLLVLAVDNQPAKWLMGENWGPQAPNSLSTYQCVTFTISYSHDMKLPPDVVGLVKTPWHILASVLVDRKTICVVLTDLTTPSPVTGRSVSVTPPEELVEEVYRQSNLPRGVVHFCWGAEWNGSRWVHNQSSGVLSTKGQIPFWGRCPSVALCGMMSPRNTPFASIEAAVEVGRRFVGVKPLRPLLITELLIGVLLLVILKHLMTKFRVGS